MAIESVFLHVTKSCNLGCSYCYFSAKTPLPDEMRLEEFVPLFQDISKLRPRKIVFTGGEPLLRGDIHQLLKAARDADYDHHLVHCLNSNGHLVTQAIAEALVGVVDEVRVSLDAFRGRNDSLRGSGNFDAVMRALIHLANAGLESRVLITVSRYCLPDLENLIVFLLEKGVTRLSLNELRPVGRAADKADWAVATGECREVLARAWRRVFGEVAPKRQGHATTDWHCGVGRFLNIMPNGDVYPCHVLTRTEFRCGNVRSTPLTEICGKGGLLDALTELQFGNLASEGGRLGLLSQVGVCMGSVYEQTRTSKAWRRSLPLVELRAPGDATLLGRAGCTK